jgi:glycosyltransferase involved in cell wall biosynthesis
MDLQAMTIDRINGTELKNDQNSAVSTRNSPFPVFLMINSFETGGSERQFANLAGALDTQRFPVHLGCIMQRGSFLADVGEVPTFGLGGSLYGLRSVAARIRLARHLRSLGISVAHSFDFYTNLTLIPAARMARVPVVIGSQRQLGDLLTKAQSRVQVGMFRWCDAVVCNSKAAADLLIRDGIPADRVVVIGNGLLPSAFAETAAALPPIPGRLRVGMIARMNALSKNHDVFLRAAAIIKHKFPDAEFLLVGDGPLRAELERLASDLSIQAQVRFLGDRRDIPAVLASMDISVMPSASESLSNVILESMAAAVPVVANRVGGNVELLDQDRGLLLDHSNERAFADAIEKLLDDAWLRATLGQNAKRFAKANFSLETVRTRHEELYQELLQKKLSKKK